jgi:SAM-dependent methyltransferase
MNCRHCENPLTHTFLDLGFAPPSNAYLKEDQLSLPEKYYPLKIMICEECWLAQTEDYAQADELFSADYAYFSSTSTSWLHHAMAYCKKITAKLNLSNESFVIEVASNDGYLLKNFVEAGIPCLGIEPTASTAEAAEKLGIPVLREFFGVQVAKKLTTENRKADLIIGNNVYAHVPDINDFTAGLKEALKKGGTITLEFPHLMQLIENKQFDTVYHEHFSYLSLNAVSRIFNKAGLRIFDLEELPTHGGSLRIFGCHADDQRPNLNAVKEILKNEVDAGLMHLETYTSFQSRADRVKYDLMDFLIKQKRAGNKVVAYGAAAKGNTLLNYAGVKPDLISFVCDAAVAKQNKFMPGSHIPILPPAALIECNADYIIILPWNIASEVTENYKNLLKKGAKFVVAVPSLKILN